jgi:hypothetical protein
MSIGAGLVLIAVGAILRFGISTVSTHGFSIHTIGDILILVGILGVVLWMVVWAPWGYRRRSVYRREVRPGGPPPTRPYPGGTPYVDGYEDDYRR